MDGHVRAQAIEMRENRMASDELRVANGEVGGDQPAFADRPSNRAPPTPPNSPGLGPGLPASRQLYAEGRVCDLSPQPGATMRSSAKARRQRRADNMASPADALAAGITLPTAAPWPCEGTPQGSAESDVWHHGGQRDWLEAFWL